MAMPAGWAGPGAVDERRLAQTQFARASRWKNQGSRRGKGPGEIEGAAGSR